MQKLYIQAENPAAAVHVPVVVPARVDPLLEQRVVAPELQLPHWGWYTKKERGKN